MSEYIGREVKFKTASGTYNSGIVIAIDMDDDCRLPITVMDNNGTKWIGSEDYIEFTEEDSSIKENQG